MQEWVCVKHLHLSSYLDFSFCSPGLWSFLFVPSKKLSQFCKLAIVHFFCVNIHCTSKHEGSWENMRQLCKPELQSGVGMTFENSPNPQVFRRGNISKEKNPLLLLWNISPNYSSTVFNVLSSKHDYQQIRMPTVF